MDDRPQVFGLHVAIGVTIEIGLDAAAIEVFAQLGPEHVQDPAAFGIGQVSKDTHRVAVVIADDGVGIIALRQDSPGVAVQFVDQGIAPMLVAVEKRLVVGGEAFV